MDKKVDGRLPNEVLPGLHGLKKHDAIKTPWERLISYYEAVNYASWFGSVFSAATLDAFRIIEPDYEARAEVMCSTAYERLTKTYDNPQVFSDCVRDRCIHPFMCGNFVGALHGDWGDEAANMPGRVNDFGTYRAEKELDRCDWDIVGSEVCRATTLSLQACCDCTARANEEGPRLEFNMVEAKGTGNRHCRIVAEDRTKYPMPAKKVWESFGPIATEDLIKDTPEDEYIGEIEAYRDDCDYRFISGTCEEIGQEHPYPVTELTTAANYVMPAINWYIDNGKVDEQVALHILECVCRTAGKAAFGEPHGRKAVREWLGVPGGMEDGRIMGAWLQVWFDCTAVPYQVVAFNKDEVVLDVNRIMLYMAMPDMQRVQHGYLAYWGGMVKTLVNAQWALWEEQCADPMTLRVKIAKKVDKFC